MRRILLVLSLASICVIRCRKSINDVNDVKSDTPVFSGSVHDSKGSPVGAVDIHFRYLRWPYDAVNKSVSKNGCHPMTGTDLSQNYPNPFPTTTRIEFRISAPSRVQLTLFSWPEYDTVRVLRNDLLESGNRCIVYDGRDEEGRKLTNGIYPYRITTSDTVIERELCIDLDESDLPEINPIVPFCRSDAGGHFAIRYSQIPIGRQVSLTDETGAGYGFIPIPDMIKIVLIKTGYKTLVEPVKLDTTKSYTKEFVMEKK
jgi:hypothetical protein